MDENRAAILTVLEDRALHSSRSIADATGMPPAKVAGYLGRMREEGLVIKDGRPGLTEWCLAD